MALSLKLVRSTDNDTSMTPCTFFGTMQLASMSTSKHNVDEILAAAAIVCVFVDSFL